MLAGGMDKHHFRKCLACPSLHADFVTGPRRVVNKARADTLIIGVWRQGMREYGFAP